jgi:hypothetical protein
MIGILPGCHGSGSKSVRHDRGARSSVPVGVCQHGPVRALNRGRKVLEPHKTSNLQVNHASVLGKRGTFAKNGIRTCCRISDYTVRRGEQYDSQSAGLAGSESQSAINELSAELGGARVTFNVTFYRFPRPPSSASMLEV